MIVGSILNGAQVAEDRDSAIATITRALVSTMVGDTIARSMDDTDRTMVLHTLENGRGGVPSRWRNPHSRNMYTVTLIRAYDVAQGPCLEYTVEAVIGGNGDKVHSTACLLPDGSWDVANHN
jgi:surface antigen